jgi:hypothetical protein
MGLKFFFYFDFSPSVFTLSNYLGKSLSNVIDSLRGRTLMVSSLKSLFPSPSYHDELSCRPYHTFYGDVTCLNQTDYLISINSAYLHLTSTF